MTDIAPARAFLHSGDFTRVGQFANATRINRGYKHLTQQQVNTATVTISAADPLVPALRPTALALGLVLVIDSSSYPVPWVGMVTRVSFLHESEQVRIRAVGWGGVLQNRAFDPTDNFDGTPGSVFSAMLQRINQLNPTGLSLGNVTDPAGAYEIDLPNARAFQGFNTLARDTGQEWSIEVAQANESGITLLMNFEQDRGEDQRGFADDLVSPGNCAVTESDIDTQNLLAAVSITGGQTSVTQAFRDRTRTTVVRKVADSGLRGFGSDASGHTLQTIDATGLRARHGVVFFPQGGGGASPLTSHHKLRVVESLRGQGGITAAAIAALERHPFAALSARITVFWDPNAPLSQWNHLQVGNLVRLQSNKAFGQSGAYSLSIVGVQPFEEGGFLDLVVWVGVD